MINGKLIIVGEIEIDGEKLTGAFVECSVGELKKGRELFYEHVTISASQKPTDIKTENATQPEIDFCPNCGAALGVK